MSLPVIASKGAVDANTDTTSSPAAPSGIVAGDLLLLFIVCHDSTSISVPNWAPVGSVSDSGNSVKAALFSRTATGTGPDAPTATFGTSVDFAAIIYRLNNQNGGTFTDVVGTNSQPSGTTPTVPTVTTTFTDELLVFLTGFMSLPSSAPSGWTQETADVSTNLRIRIFSEPALSAGNYGGEGFTLASSAAEAGLLIAIKSTTSSSSTPDLLMGGTCGV